MGVSQPNLGVLFNISFIVLGVVVASFGEITFVLIGFIYQCAGIAFESTRLVLIQKLLNGDEYKMDPLVSLYYYAPVCAVMNTAIALVMEIPYITKDEISAVGLPILFANALVAFLLNVSAVFLVRVAFATFTSSDGVLTCSDWQNILSCYGPLWYLQRYPPSYRLDAHLGYPSYRPAMVWLHDSRRWLGVL